MQADQASIDFLVDMFFFFFLEDDGAKYHILFRSWYRLTKIDIAHEKPL